MFQIVLVPHVSDKKQPEAAFSKGACDSGGKSPQIQTLTAKLYTKLEILWGVVWEETV